MNRPRRPGCRSGTGWLILLGAATTVGSLVALALPTVLAVVVDTALTGKLEAAQVGGLVGVLATGWVAMVATAVATGTAVASRTAGLRIHLLRRILGAGLAGTRRYSAGDLTSRLVASTGDAATRPTSLVVAAGGLVLTLGGLGGLALLDWRLPVAFLLTMPPALATMYRFVGAAGDLYGGYRAAQGRITGLLTDALAGVRTIRAAGSRDSEVERILRPLPELDRCGRAFWAAQTRAIWRLELTVPLTEAVVLGVAGLGVSAGRLTAGQMLAAAAYTTLALGYLAQVESMIELAEARAGRRRVAEVLTDLQDRARVALPQPEPADAAGPVRAVAGAGRRAAAAVRLVDVGLCRGGGVLLDHLTLAVPPGISLAVVGASGAGKSAFAAVAGGLEPPDSGQVLLDGRPLDRWPLSELRSRIGYGFERPVLVGHTVREALDAGRGLPRGEVERAA
ncbi:MAG TPA: ABC transporter ATP-binding protein, partial [Pseudonocardiaceae bacterium]|nr:ABC transporter ATP-binding protein [Pseudonocardiaceae bacterium]